MVQSLDRAVDLLFAAAEEPLTAAGAAERLGVHRTTAIRLLQTLESRRLVRRITDGRFVLGLGLAWLGTRATEQVDVRQYARPRLAELGAATKETVHLAMVSGDDIVYVDRVDSLLPVRPYSRVGALTKLHCSAVARAVIAFADADARERYFERMTWKRYTPRTITTRSELVTELAATRERGYSLDLEEVEDGINWIASPIFDASGEPTGALSVSAPSARCGKADLEAIAGDLLRSSEALSRELGAPEGVMSRR